MQTETVAQKTGCCQRKEKLNKSNTYVMRFQPIARFLGFFSWPRFLTTTGSTISPQFRHLHA